MSRNEKSLGLNDLCSLMVVSIFFGRWPDTWPLDSGHNVEGHRFAHHERWSPTPKCYQRTRQPSNSRRVGDSVHRLVRLGCVAWSRPCPQNLDHLGLDEIFKLSYSFLCAVTDLRGKRVDLDEIQLLDILAQRSHLTARECIATLLGYPAFIQQSEISAVSVVEDDLKIREWLDRNLFAQVRARARRKMRLYLDLRWHYLYNSSF